MQAAGIRRIVSRRPYNIERVVTVSGQLGIDLVFVPDDDAANARRAALVAKTLDDGDGGAAEKERILEDRRERKRAKIAHVEMKRLAGKG